MSDLDKLLTISQVASLHEVDEGAVRYWIRSGLLPVCRSIRPVLIDPKIARAFIRPGKRKPAKRG